MGTLVKYHALCYHVNTVKGIMDRIKFHLQTKNNVIHQIMQKYNSVGKQLSTLFASFVYSAAGVMILCHLSPIVLDIIMPLNESRPIKLPVDVVTFFDKEKHPIIITTFYYLWIAIVSTTYVGTESLMIMICLHAASLFEVTR
ncbi:uncharacterized protein LOC105663776 [Megachile rotundata]|uniref:uncharacterized protein LOC105663776 n=1 Tax=Megachile rotundata TaxID=143995 RepID=UPI003FCF4492